MTWQIASLALLALALGAGLLWYERTHPSSKVLALVATLAALAVLGRMAFAPLPSIKPTTDIVLLSGYVLGGAPGFAVGAVTALASNFFFGQGPYTPWQMVGWGGVGVFGAVLGTLFAHRMGRVPLALACGLAGLAYGLFLDFSQWVTYSAHTTAELAAYLGRGVPFNVAHALGNVLFFLAFGPMLVRALERFRGRFEITWRPAPVAGAALAVLAVAGAAAAAPTTARAAEDRAIARGVAYLQAAQTADGGYADAKGGTEAEAIASGWAVLGLVAAGRDPGEPARRWFEDQAGSVDDVGDMERTLLGLAALGGPTDALAEALSAKEQRDGAYEDVVNRTAFAVLAYRAAGRRPTTRTISWLLEQQNRDGGWSVGGRGGPSGVDDTAAVVQALVAAGRRKSRAVKRASAWLVRRQGSDGGFPLTPGAPSNAQSTAFTMQALDAAGRDVDHLRRRGSRTPRAYLRSLQAADGSFRYSRVSDQTPTWVTAQVVAALAGKPLPVRRVTAKASKSTGLHALTALILGAFL